MKIAIESSAYFADELVGDYEQGIATMRSHGYDGMDLQSFIDIKDGLLARDPSAWERELLALRAAARREGVDICQSHAPGGYPPQDATDADRARRFAAKEQALYGCAILECPYLVVHPILPYGTKVNVNPDGVWEINVEFF